MIGLIGVNHLTAGLDERACFALSEGEASMLMEDWIACGLVSGGLILSTCNRVEIYYEIEGKCPRATERSLIASFLANLELPSRYAQYLMTRQAEEVYRHLFRLASGLESLVVGETQILGQIKSAYRMASLAGYCSGSLSRLFHRAFEVAKRIRHHYLVSATPLSAGSAAVERLLSLLPQPRQVLIVGAGLMADAVYEDLLRRGQAQNQIVVYNRTRERAERFAEQHPGARIACESLLAEQVQGAEAIIVATSAPAPILGVEHFSVNPRCVIIDLAVPRNVAVEVGALPGIDLISIDDLGGQTTQFSDQDLSDIENIITEYVLAHKQWVEAAQIREVIAEIQETSQHLLTHELAHLPTSLSPTEQALIAEWDEHFRITYTTALVSALREVSEEGLLRKYSEALRQIFANIKKKYS